MPARLPIRIAPAGAVPPRVGEEYTHPTLGSATLTPGVREGDRVVHNGTTFNGRGYRVCGVVNQRGTLCGRIGTCPYHHGQQQDEQKQPQNSASLSTCPSLSHGRGPAPAVREQQQQQPRPLVPSADSGNAGSAAIDYGRNNGNRVDGDAPARPPPIAAAGTCPKSVLHLDAAPAKAGFKRSWSREEHARFLLALRRRGRGKWKEIARDIGTRTANQCQSHAQKHFLRQAKDVSKRMKPSIHDITEVADVDDRPPEPPASLTFQETSPVALVTHKKEESRAEAGSATGTGAAIQERPRPASDNRRHGREARLTAKSVTAVAPLREDNAHHVTRKESTILVGDQQTDRPLQEDAQLLLENFAIGARATHASCLQSISNPTAGTERRESPPPAAEAACGPSEGLDDPWRTVPILIPVSELQNHKQFVEWIQPNAGVFSKNDAAFRENSSSAPAHAAGQPTHPFAALQMSVRIHRNGTSTAEGLSVTFPESMEFDDFLVMAAKELGVPPNLSRIFTRSGGEISSLDEVIEDEALWLSNGEEFFYPAL